MWKIFGYSTQTHQGETSQPDLPPELSLKELRNQLQLKMRTLTTMFQQSESLLDQHFQPAQLEERVAGTFTRLVLTLEGINSIITSLQAEEEHVRQELRDHLKLKQMVENHENIVSALQDSHSSQVAALYQSKSRSEDKLKAEIQTLGLENIQLREELRCAIENSLAKEAKVQQSNQEILKLKEEISQLKARLNEMQSKYQTVVGYSDSVEHRRIINLEHLQLQHIFYYSTLKHRILWFLNIQDLSRLERTCKFFYCTLKRQQPSHTFSILKKEFSKKVSQDGKKAKEYEKIFELFPIENIKVNALKYLHFKIRPATYILPYLQEEQIQSHKKDLEKTQKKETRFSWKTLFADKTKTEKKEENKFNLSSLKQEEEFKKIQSRIDSQFRNIIQFRMPEDLHDFSSTMEKQLGELKTELGHLRAQGGQAEWTAQLCCLSRYMYHQINQLYSLAQVIFGELLKKNYQSIQLRDNLEYVTENEQVLRNLIENLAGDKHSLEKKLLVAESEVLRNQLEKEAMSHHCQRVTAEIDVLQKQLKALEQEHNGCKSTIEKHQEESRRLEDSMFAIREEIEALERGSVRSRHSSLGSEEERQ